MYDCQKEAHSRDREIEDYCSLGMVTSHLIPVLLWRGNSDRRKFAKILSPSSLEHSAYVLSFVLLPHGSGALTPRGKRKRHKREVPQRRCHEADVKRVYD